MKFSNDNLKVSLNTEKTSLVHWGPVTSISPSNSTMSVQVISDGGITATDIPINQFFTTTGAGIKYMPVISSTYALLYKANTTKTSYVHLGFFSPDVSPLVADPLYTKKGDLIYQRYLKEGEIQIISITGTEIFFSENGDLFIKNNKNSFIKLNNYFNDLEIHVPNVSIANYNVNIKTGRVVRNTLDAITKDVKVNPSTKEAYTEFTIDIGTTYNIETGLPISTRTGTLSFSDRVFNLQGQPETAYQGAEHFLNFLLNLMSGIKISVDEAGDLHVVSKSNNSRFSIQTGEGSGGKDLTEIFFKTKSSEFRVSEEVFSYVHKVLGYFINLEIKEDGTSSFAIRIGDNTITLSADRGLQISQESGAGIIYGEDGSIIINDTKGHTLVMNDTGITYNSDGDMHTFCGDTVNITTAKGIVVGNAATDGVLLASKTALLFDSHVHAGPSGPPVVPWTPQLASVLVASGVKVG